jgi:sulfate/thiosulfate transport system ATP-binding protein
MGDIYVSILVYKISKFIEEQCILDRISFYLPEGCLAALLGPSGSGKSTLLRVISGLEEVVGGSIWLDGRDCTHLQIQYRRMGFVFQSFALFSHMTVTENISFGLKLRYVSQDEICNRVDSLLTALRITDIALRYPHQLSGGQKQRVALARTLAIEPRFLLLDEPFKALDSELRTYLSRWLRTFLKEKKITALMVTHDQTEAFSIADEILVLREGRLAQQSKPNVLYDNPINSFIGKFTGPVVVDESNIWPSAVLLRSYELQLAHEEDNQSFPAKVGNIVYKRHFVELDIWIVVKSTQFKLQLGYVAFKELQIRTLDQPLCLRLRKKSILRLT